MSNSSAISQGGVQSKVENAIAYITFFHPLSNSLPSKVLSQLRDTILEMGKRMDIRVIVLQSEGEKTFCGGASFDELISIDNSDKGLQFFSGFANVINAIRTCGKIVIGRVQGKAVGGGVGLASAVDYCFATKQASIKLSELAVGIGPFVIGPAVERKAGISAFGQMALNAQTFYSADWAREKGIYYDVFETIDDMDKALQQFAFTLANSNPEALLELKQIFWKGTEHWDSLLVERAKISGQLVLSDFTRKAIQQFKSK